jgi:dihydrofolate synthase / folylpolyglutamate synthase
VCSILKDTNTTADSDAFAWLSSFNKYGWMFGLERIVYLMNRLGNPHLEFKVVHVAGTNGKGSVCKYISSILQKAHYQVGLYLSPHIERFSERIVVNGTEISEEDLIRLIEQIRPVVDEMQQDGYSPTYFEIVTAIAFLHFRNQKVDYAVIEVGLGGRFDATNVVVPLVSVITNISLEHTNILGNEIASIAFEKAGVIKEHVPVVTAATRHARETIETVAIERDAPLIFIDRPMWKRVSLKDNCQEFFIQGAFKDYIVKTSMLGLHQGENIAVAIAAVERLQMNGVYIADGDISEGIAAATHPGRMEIVSEKPLILLDGAHNPDGMLMLAKTIKQDFTYSQMILILGVLKDKDMNMMITTIVPLADLVIVTQSTNPRAYDPLLLKEKIEKFDATKKVCIEASLSLALEHAKKMANRKDLICVSGSLFTVGEARSYLLPGNTVVEKSMNH